MVYRFSGNVMTSITTLRTQRQNFTVFTPEMRFQSICYMINIIQHSCSCIIEFIKLVAKEIKCSASLAFYLFTPTRLINSIKNEHSYKILYVICSLIWILKIVLVSCISKPGACNFNSFSVEWVLPHIRVGNIGGFWKFRCTGSS